MRASVGAAVNSLAGAFEDGELAFLAATSKPELPIRDRVAWHASRSLGDEYVVSREWRRADIAILRGSDVVTQIEAKAMYSFDVLQQGGRQAYLKRMIADAVKMSALARSDRYLLSTVTDVRGNISESIRKYVVKYSPLIARAAGTHGSDAVQHLSRQRWSRDLEDTFGGETAVTHVEGGRVWGLEVSVDVFLTGPLTGEEHTTASSVALEASAGLT
ncbi:hypothetical protein ASH01_11510 [Terrabacter sp. Soil811]|nr:hypothetical protein ASH01_11510 [Terrabacter sp. Soil811]